MSLEQGKGQVPDEEIQGAVSLSTEPSSSSSSSQQGEEIGEVTSLEQQFPPKNDESSSWEPFEDQSRLPIPFQNTEQSFLKQWYRWRWRVLNPFHMSVLLCGYDVSLGEMLIMLIALAGSGVAGFLGFEAGEAEDSGTPPDVLLAITFALAARNSIISFLLGIPFERALFWHKLFAVLTVILGGIHGLAAVKDNGWVWTGEEDFASGYVWWASMMALIVFSLFPIRRYLFETFYRFHWVLFITAAVAGLVHGGGVFLIGAGLWLLDVLYRYFFLSFTQYPTDATIEALPANVIRISWPTKPPNNKGKVFEYEAGQYVFICVPGISSFQWHPFSLSSSPHHERACVHIRVLGDWTKALYKHATAEHNKTVRILLDGPYGNPGVNIWGDSPLYKHFIMISGGIGITPLQSISNTLMHQHLEQGRDLKRIRFVWSVRDRYIIDSLQGVEASTRLPFSFTPDLLEHYADVAIESGTTRKEDPLIAQFHLTQCKRADSIEKEKANIKPDLQPFVKFGRPDIESIFQEMTSEISQNATTSDKTHVAVLVCGPAVLVNATRRQCFRQSTKNIQFHFHTETFEF